MKSRDNLAQHKRPYAHEHAPTADFLAAIKSLKPTAIIGVAAVGGTFTRDVVQEMADNNERPIIFALSNPTSKSECTAAQAYEWSGGRALFASGSPFDPVTLAGKTLRAAAGQQLVHLPRRGPGRDRQRVRGGSPTRCS